MLYKIKRVVDESHMVSVASVAAIDESHIADVTHMASIASIASVLVILVADKFDHSPIIKRN